MTTIAEIRKEILDNIANSHLDLESIKQSASKVLNDKIDIGEISKFNDLNVNVDPYDRRQINVTFNVMPVFSQAVIINKFSIGAEIELNNFVETTRLQRVIED